MNKKKNAKEQKETLLAFIPVLHKGYIDLFKKYPYKLYIFDYSIINQYTSLTRDLRVIDPLELKKAIEGLDIFKEVHILEKEDFKKIKGNDLILPDEDISHKIVDEHFKSKNVRYEKVFLRWDKIITTTEHVVPEYRKKVKSKEKREIIKKAFNEAEKSSDWWRRIGAVLVKGNKILIISHNRHLPTDYHLYQNGDPRSNFNAGERLDIYTSIHGESDIIAKAAKRGISLEGTDIYVTTFPCSNCARLIGESGIKRVYYSEGYSRLDAEDIFRAYGVDIFLVE